MIDNNIHAFRFLTIFCFSVPPVDYYLLNSWETVKKIISLPASMFDVLTFICKLAAIEMGTMIDTAVTMEPAATTETVMEMMI